MTRPRLTTRLTYCLTLAALAATGCAISQDATPRQDYNLTEKLDPVLHRLDAEQSICAARVVDLETRRELYAANPDRPMIPASNGKLAVSAAALDTFGPDYTFKTYLAQDDDDLWVIGTGDPALGDPNITKKHGQTPTTVLDQWAAALKAKGVTRVRTLYYYDGAFESQQLHPTWSRSYITDWYAAPVSGINYNDNCVDVSVTPAEPGKPANYSLTTPVTDARIINNTVSGGDPAELTPRDNPAIEREPAAMVYTLTGHVLKPTKLESKAVTDPGAFFADALRTRLTAAGITVDRIAHADAPLGGSEIPAADKVVATHETTFADIINRINRNSQNLFAECMDKAVGNAYFTLKGDAGPGSWAKGETAVKAFLRSYKIDDKALHAADGSGLSRENRVTTRLITDLLTAMHRHRYATTFRESLSQPGEEATLRSRLPDLKGRVWAKTGYIGGVRSLSGYVHTKHGRWLAFSFLYNDIPGNVKRYETLQDDAVRVLYNEDQGLFHMW